MKRVPIKLQTKITVLVIVIVTISIYTTMYFATRQMVSNIQREMDTNIMNVAQVLANSAIVIEGIRTGDYEESAIQPFVEKILATTEQVEVIVVADMEGLRYGHNLRERLGQRFVGGDELRVLEHGDSYLSEATGTLGRQIRAFVPVYDLDTHEQLGFVMTANLTQTIRGIRRQRVITIMLVSSIGLFLGIIGAVLLARNIKKILLGLEPEEISKLYLEKQGMLDAIHEGIIAIDENLQITLINDSATKLLGTQNTDVIGKNVLDVFPTSRLPEVLRTGIAEYNREQVINNTFIITNRVPITDGEKIVGAISTFRDKTLITRLAEEVTGVRLVVDALRANTHEFMNKLHVILGLMEIGELQEAKRFIVNVRENQQQIISLVTEKIKDPAIIGLLLGKVSRAKELGITMNISEDSCLEKRKDIINSNTLITIIGNLIENAMDAVSNSREEDKTIDISIRESLENIRIEVKDVGVGIEEKDRPYIFDRGFSTKEGSRGIGLALIKEMVENLGGNITVIDHVEKGTKFSIILPKGEEL
ncbi:signal transduction histidine kinase regulating citrate/malate metabolism [Alkaliphilus metalliredigens QYMF]|uniref:histidine kinase n=1 Tax=Alkaliphilus metalliredigens (strain QYMF) TaxID=293826 RepID=A6TSE9_ALKMQ|nr:ATP-binding protein [Alkaliphilus metalliredigens]ABR49117.1 signal transduction histidine kinase regulating citrate/malate metabolism [Alkaliphilus metalliredigens QYMF]